jgi:hypothetical protein
MLSSEKYDNARDRNIFHFIGRMIMQIPVRTSRSLIFPYSTSFKCSIFGLSCLVKRYKPRSFCHFIRIIKSFGSGGEY